MIPRVYAPILRGRLAPRFFCALLFGVFPIAAVSAAAFPQEPAPASESIADAARKSRESKPNPDSTNPTKVLTNDDLSVGPAAAEVRPRAHGDTGVSGKQSAPGSEATKPQEPICPNANQEQIDNQLQAAQEELAQLRRELSANGPVISNGDVDLSNFKPGSSGVTFGSPPLSEATPQAPGRVKGVELEEKVAALKKAALIACDSREEAKTRQELDSADSQLKLLLKQFDLDQSVYYSKTDYTGDAAGKARLDAEQQQIQALQEVVDRLRQQLPTEN